MSVTESAVIRAMRQFKDALASREAAQVKLMARRYLEVERALEAQIAALSEQIASSYAQGVDPTWSSIYRLERFQRLLIQLGDELESFNAYAADLVQREQYALAQVAISNAADALEYQAQGYASRVHRLPSAAIANMVGLAGDGSPLASLLATSFGAAREAIIRELIKSVALGRNPRVTAAALRRAAGVPLNRALLIARTEQMRVYNEALLDAYRSAGVTLFQRLATYDDRTCMACISMSGEIVTSELHIDDHPGGRCTAVPLLDGVRLPQFESSEAWFNRQSSATQLRMMGPGRYDLWRSGRASWHDMATHKHDPVWGGSYVTTPLRDLRNSAAA